MKFVRFLILSLISIHGWAGNETQYVGLQRLLNKPLSEYSHIQNILEDLPLYYRNRYALIYQGGGPQHASFQFPRVIMGSCEDFCDQEPSAVIAFHGNQAHSTYDHMEVAQYLPQEKRVQFFVIHEKDRGLYFSEANPPQCTSCHFNDPMPIWAPYPVWPGHYRSEIHKPMPEIERVNFEKFWSTREANPRYRVLGDKKDVFLSPNVSVNPNYEVEQNNPTFLTVVGISRMMSTMTDGVLERKIREVPNYSKLKYALAGAISRCDIELFFPETVKSTFFYQFRPLFEQIFAVRKKLPEAQQPSVNYDPYPLAQLSYVLMNFGQEPKEFLGEGHKKPSNYLFGDTDYVSYIFMRKGLAQDEDLKPFVIEDRDHEYKFQCDPLQKKSLSQF